MRTARRVLLSAWSGYVLWWLTLIATLYYGPWRPHEVSFRFLMPVMLGWGLGLMVILLALAIGVVFGWHALRQPEHRTRGNLVLVGISTCGVAAHAFWIGLGILRGMR